MKTVLKFIIALIVVFVIIGIGVVACTSSVFNSVDEDMKKSEEVSVGKSDDKADKKSDDKADKKAKDLKFGDTFSVGKIEFTISKPKNEQPGQYDSAKSGNIVVFDVVAKNNSKEQVFIDSTEFNLYDKNGEQIESTFLGDDYGLQGDVNAGRTIKGKLYFDTKAGQSLELVYSPTFSWTNVEVTLKGNN